MATKRDFPCANGGRSESPTRSGGSKRLCCGRHDQQGTLQELNPSDRQPVEDLCQKYRVNVPQLSSRTHMYRLQFRNKLPNVLYTDKKLKAENNREVEISMVDASNIVISSGPEGEFNKHVIEIFVLDGDFHGNDNGECTEEEFNKHVIVARKDKPALLSGNVYIELCDGVGYITDAKFTDNSSWTKSKNFRLGARLCRGEGMAGKVQEGISNAFRVKDRHGEKCQKDRPPPLNADVCCLKGISKNGSYRKKLAKYQINTVKELLSYCRANPHKNVGTMIGMKERAWKNTYGHAIESEVCSAIIPNNPFSLPTHDQNCFEEVAGSNSPQISNTPVQPDGIPPKVLMDTDLTWPQVAPDILTGADAAWGGSSAKVACMQEDVNPFVNDWFGGDGVGAAKDLQFSFDISYGDLQWNVDKHDTNMTENIRADSCMQGAGVKAAKDLLSSIDISSSDLQLSVDKQDTNMTENIRRDSCKQGAGDLLSPFDIFGNATAFTPQTGGPRNGKSALGDRSKASSTMGSCKKLEPIKVPRVITAKDVSEDGVSVTLNPANINVNIKRLEEKALIGNLLGRKLPLSFLNEELEKQWSHLGRFILSMTGPDCFTCVFEDEAARDAVLMGSPWFLAGRLIGIRKWNTAASSSSLHGLSSPVWIRLPQIPLVYWDDDNILRIAAMVGQPLWIDAHTSLRGRSSYARVCVQLDLSKKHMTDVLVYGLNEQFVQPVVYEGFSQESFKCGKGITALSCYSGPPNPN